MDELLIKQIANELKIKSEQVKSVLSLLEEGGTVPFIARYRKEATGGLDEDAIRLIEDGYKYQVNLKKRKEDVLRIIGEQGKMSDEIKKDVEACTKLSQVEDIYRPYQQKKKTRATMAIADGLEPLALLLLNGDDSIIYLEEAVKYLTDKIKTGEEALQGAMDIVAEQVSDNPKVRNRARVLMMKTGFINTKAKKNFVDERHVYQMYYEYNEKLASIANHRIMAINRAESEKVISVSITFEQEQLSEFAHELFVLNKGKDALKYLSLAMNDGLKRLLVPSVENEIRKDLLDRAMSKSIDLFSMNVEKLLLQAPMKDKVVLGFDPAFRTGCKLAVIDQTGKLLKIDVIYPHEPVNKKAEAKAKVLALLEEYPINIIAIGNGTASRESQAFIAEVIHEANKDVAFTLVSEAGASVYSASALAKEEFPELTVEKRSAVSIARRIIDPLAELIKIDPQSIGVGQYQHDLPTKQLSESLDFVVMKAVNRVGVNLNTASPSLLKNVAGLSATSAKSIVAYRDKIGEFSSRQQLLKVPKLGPKSYEQAAGFLRINNGKEILDGSSIHPESYDATKKLMEYLSIEKSEIGTEDIKKKFYGIPYSKMCEIIGVDEYTLMDIMDALKQPNRDYREKYEAPLLRSDVLELEDLHIGDELEGVVRNVVDFGAFVDIGLHEDGLVHVSKLSNTRVSHPSEVVSIGDIVKVKVFNIDTTRNKVQLSLV